MNDPQKKIPTNQHHKSLYSAALHVWDTSSKWCLNWKIALEKEGFDVFIYDLKDQYTAHATEQDNANQSSIHFYEFKHEVSYIHFLKSFLPVLQRKGIFTVLLAPASSDYELGESLDVAANWILPCNASQQVIQNNLLIILQLIRIQNFATKD